MEAAQRGKIEYGGTRLTFLVCGFLLPGTQSSTDIQKLVLKSTST